VNRRRDLRAAICLFVRNEARDIAEWLAFHFAAGFDAAIVYDNGSSDGTADIAWRFFSKHLAVHPIDWPTTAPDAQIACYEHCLRHFGAGFDWITFIDADEMLVPRAGDIKALLAARADASAIVVNWATFGSNRHATRPAGTMIEAFTRRAPSDFPPNGIVKYIVRPPKVTATHAPCLFEVSGPVVTPEGHAPAWKNELVSTVEPEHTAAAVHHYFTRSREDWARKMDRGYRCNRERAATLRPRFSDFDRNDIEDRAALRFLPAMRRTLQWVEAA
jgi:glycosyltransferase involved in cell wall biosynthesis